MRILPLTVTPPATLPVTLAQLRAQVRVDSADDDPILTGLLFAATAHIENSLGRPIVTRAVRAVFEQWPCSQYRPLYPPFALTRSPTDTAIELLMPVTAVTAISYTAADQSVQTWTSFIVRNSPGGKSYVRPASGTDWPTLGTDPLITLDATAGWAKVPEPVVQAIMLLGAHLYLNREEVLTGARIVALQLPVGVTELIAPYRWRWVG